jgi:hypothetical protein
VFTSKYWFGGGVGARDCQSCFALLSYPNVLLFLEHEESEYPNFGTQKQTNIPILGFCHNFFFPTASVWYLSDTLLKFGFT